MEIPQAQVASTEDLESLPLAMSGARGARVGDVATVSQGTMAGLVERYNGQRVIRLTANVHGIPLGQGIAGIRTAIARAGDPPRGVTVAVRGQIPLLEQAQSGLATGLLVAIPAILLLLAGYFQSVRMALTVLSTVPAVVAGVAMALTLTRTTLNVQSFMGAIMAMGIAVSNAILVATAAEERRQAGATADEAAHAGGTERLRAILMTASAMIAGMIPMALGLGEGGGQAAPLGRAASAG